MESRRNDFHDVSDGDFRAGTATGIYTTQPAIPMPPEARYVRVVFEPQGGGTQTFVEAYLVTRAPSLGDIFENLVWMMFTNNLLGAMVEIDLLPLILFSIVFGGMLTTLGDRAKTITHLVVSINEALMDFILLLMTIAPLGIFCLVAARFAKAQLDNQFKCHTFRRFLCRQESDKP